MAAITELNGLPNFIRERSGRSSYTYLSDLIGPTVAWNVTVPISETLKRSESLSNLESNVTLDRNLIAAWLSERLRYV